MGVLTRAKKRKARELDWISNLPDGVLGDIVSLLPTKDGARTQILSSRWRHLWRSTPLNFHLLHDAGDHDDARASEVSRILSAHPGPCRQFVMPRRYDSHDHPTMATLDGWFRSPALDNLQELIFYHYPRIPLPPSIHRFSSTLRIGNFGGCAFPDGRNGGEPLLLPVLESLTLLHVSISGSTLLALLAGCPALQSFVLIDTYNVSSPLQIVSPSLKSISVSFNWKRLFELVVEDAPCLERIQCSENEHMNISVISAPRLAILGELSDNIPRLRFGTTVLQGSTVVTRASGVHSVKAVSLSCVKLCLGAVINLLKCFPNLEKLHIKARSVSVQNAWCQRNPERIGTINICMRKIVLENYQGSKSHVDFVNFFLSNARTLESVQLRVRNITTHKWIRRQRSLLNIKSASRDPLVTFLPLKKT